MAPDGLLTVSYKNKKHLSGDVLKTQTIKIYFQGAIGAITKCRSVSTFQNEIWGHDKITDNIYFNGGKIGIGTKTPLADVDVAGGIKVGNETTANLCNASMGGALRYHSSGKMQYCKASNSTWTTIAE